MQGPGAGVSIEKFLGDLKDRPEVLKKKLSEAEKLEADKKAEAARVAEQIEARKNAEKILNEANFRCPRTSQELTDGIKASLELGNTTVYRALVSCPKP